MASDPRALFTVQRQTLAPHISELIKDDELDPGIGLTIEMLGRWGMAVEAVLQLLDSGETEADEIRRAITKALEGGGEVVGHDLVAIGYAIIPCADCDTPRHVPVGAACYPGPTGGAKAFRIKREGGEIGRAYVEMRALPDGHRCGPKRGKPAPGYLKVVDE